MSETIASDDGPFDLTPSHRKVHAALASGGAAECTCEECNNCVAVRAQFFGDQWRILEQLGITPPVGS